MFFLKFCLICVNAVLIYTFNCEKSIIHTCENENITEYINSVDIASVGFANRSGQTGCKCEISAQSSFNVILKVLIVKQYNAAAKFPLTLNYTHEGMNYTLTDLGKLPLFETSDLILAPNSSKVILDLKPTGKNGTHVDFIFSIRTCISNVSERITLQCVTQQMNDTNTSDAEYKEHGLLNEIQKLCSAHLVILLSALNVAFLILILIISISLCCVMPRKQRKEIAKLRQSVLLEKEMSLYMNQTDTVRPETVIYENPNTGFSRACDITPKVGRNEYANLQLM